MKIGKPEITRRDGDAVYEVPVHSSRGPDRLWYRVEARFGDFVADTCDAPLVALLIPAMTLGEDVEVAGVLSERLLYNIAGPYQRVLERLIPSLRRVKVQAEDVRHAHPRFASGRPPGVATGFSGGIDSFCLLADHHLAPPAEVPPSFRLTHLLFNDVGSHGRGGERLFLERFAALKPHAERIGLPFIKVSSNLAAFYEGAFKFVQTHTPRNVSVALLLGKGIGRYLYASGTDYANVFVGPSREMSCADAIALPMLSTESMEAFSVGSEYTRVEKTLRVAGIAEAHAALDVCTRSAGPGNCSTCGKCMRTLVTLEIGGVLDRFAPSFDLAAYARRRDRYLRAALRSRHHYIEEIRRLARERGVDLLPRRGAWARLRGGLAGLLRGALRAVRSVRSGERPDSGSGRSVRG